jgi:hypothetical protein
VLRTSIALGLSGLFLWAGCGAPFEAATPPGFVDLSDRYDDDEYRATTADGLVIGARAFENDPPAELAFAVQATKNRMRELGGYALIGERDVKARNGLPGKQLDFGHDQESTPHLYVLTLFVDDDHIYILEAGGTKEQVLAARAQIDWAVQSFLPG